MIKRKKNKLEFTPVFKNVFYMPRYWGVWLITGIIIFMTWIPIKIRDPILGVIGKIVGRFAKKARFRAQMNLTYCLPEISVKQREIIISDMFSCIPKVIIFMAEVAYRNLSQALTRVRWHGYELLNEFKKKGDSIIFFVPHSWSVDIPAMLMSASGYKIAAMYHNQRNELIDYIWNRARTRFGGRMHARNKGIKPFISSIRQGYWGYYLPDEDYGKKHSEFVDFFATYKATLFTIGQLMKVCHATIIPLFSVYNSKTSYLDIYILPAIDNLTNNSNINIARIVNEKLEKLIRPNLEQYTWILKLLKTRKSGESSPYDK